ncbi:hypothetical protein [Rhodococcus pyridinivorans]|uniref:hypothetical protein n=1 Tax=Rhodococcus pyridinivorans TaxID=103816 RepID=UPI0037C79A59
MRTYSAGYILTIDTSARDSCSFAVPARRPVGVCANEIWVLLGAGIAPVSSTIGAGAAEAM